MAQINKPYTFQAGTKARANEVNADFDTVYSGVNSLDTEVSNLSTQIDILGDNKADINGSTSQRFQVANAVNGYDAINKNTLEKERYKIGEPIPSLIDSLEENEIWLQGQTVSRSDYSELFNVYGTKYGEGDGSYTFKLPDFRDRTIWGSDEFGYIEAGLPNITGNFTNSTNGEANASGAFYKSGSGKNSTQASANGYKMNFDASRSSSIYGKSTTVQPPSVKVRFKTRYK